MSTILQITFNKIYVILTKTFTNRALWIVGIIGGFLSYMLGGWDVSLQTLIIFMTVDYVTGVLAGAKEVGWSSKIAKGGTAAKGVTLLVIMIAVQTDRLMGTTITREIFIYFYVANELGSIIENLGRLNCPLPPMIKDIMMVLRNKGGQSDVPFTDSDGEENE